MFDAEELKIRIGVKGFSGDTTYRKIEVSVNSDMSAADVEIIESDEHNNSLMSESFSLTNDGSLVGETFYVQVSHSSNGRDYGAGSNILTVRFADGMTAGTSGSFDPAPALELEVS